MIARICSFGMCESSAPQKNRIGPCCWATRGSSAGDDPSAVERNRRLQRKRRVGQKRDASAHAEADAGGRVRQDARILLQPVKRRARVGNNAVGRKRLHVRHAGRKIRVHAFEARPRAVKQFRRDRHVALLREAVRNIANVGVHAERFLKYKQARRFRALRRSRHVCVHGRSIRDLQRNVFRAYRFHRIFLAYRFEQSRHIISIFPVRSKWRRLQPVGFRPCKAQRPSPAAVKPRHSKKNEIGCHTESGRRENSCRNHL